MPRIRKKTTKRGSTNQREKIKHKAAETRKKRKRDTKKNAQWKTKTPKDPGIPNTFPYKDQILAEVADERRKVIQEKDRRKEEKKVAKAQAAAGGAEDDLQEKSTSSSAARDQVDTAEDDSPVLANRDLPNLRSVLKESDVVVQVLDARDPLRCRSTSLDEAVKGKKVLYVLTKIDACPREAVQEWASTLCAQHPTAVFRSASAFLPTTLEPAGKGKGKERADDAWGVDSIRKVLGKWAQEKGGDSPLVVAVVGATNVGKSSFINSLLRNAILPTYKLSMVVDSPTTTIYPQETSLEVEGKAIRLIDTPGLAWQAPSELPAEEVERIRARDILQRNRGRVERLKDPTPVVAELVSRAEREDLMLFYNLPAFAAGDANAFLSGVARANGLIKKAGVLDLAVASRIVLRDWSTDKFPRYTRPLGPVSTSAAADSTAAFAEVSAKNDEIISRLETRKEMRKTRGAVRMTPGEVELREVALDNAYFRPDAKEEGSDEDEDDEMDGGEDVDELDDSDGEDEEGAVSEGAVSEGESDDEEEEEEEEDAVPASAPGKRKRGAVQKAPARPTKKVAFAAEPKGTKQARSAAGAAGSQVAASKSKADQRKAKPTPEAKPAKVQKKAPSVSAAIKKIANSKKAKQPSSVSKDGEETYDFSKFF